MNKTWCPHCGHANPYETVKPRRCAKCDQDMTTAFQTTPVSQPAGTPPKVVIASTPDPITLRRPVPRYNPAEDERGPRNTDETYKIIASQMLGAFRGFEMKFGDINIAGGATRKVKLGELEGFRQAASEIRRNPPQEEGTSESLPQI